ncbi:MAG: polysaccharide biosynthesis protein [Deltaproteobacteria bacterium]|nr:polysaccharide biosynthesis protein [Deltaproteobacteria bacterium]
MVRYHRLFLLPLDAVFVALSHILAYLIRFEGQIPSDQRPFFWTGLALTVLAEPVVFLLSGFYRRIWRYISIPDLIHIVKTVSIASMVATLVSHFFLFSPGYSRSVPVLTWLLVNGFIMARSLAWRLFTECRQGRQRGGTERILIVGAGMGGKLLFQEIKQNPDMAYSVVGFLDDDPKKVGAFINDKPVLGTISQLRRISMYHGVRRVIIAIPSAPARLIREVVHLCRKSGIEVQTLPAMADILDVTVLASQVRDVNLEDLLGRAPVMLDAEKIRSYLTGRRILVTGAGGSIGSEICRQVVRFNPREIVLFDIAETPLHQIHLELQRDFPEGEFTPVLADVRDRDQVYRIFEQTRPEVVFHAAAYKHVPMMEFHPAEAIKTNVLGTRNLAEAAEAVWVERFVMISTDKAVNPTNVMGASKRAAEIFVQAFSEESKTEFITVRFGNVLGSSGSVVPHFQEQIRRGGPVTVTHPDVIRYFMTIPEASQLVLQAGSMGHAGEIFLLDMGEPIKILDLAKELIRLSGLKPHEDIEIVFTGLRPGEKLYEELLIAGEGIKPTDHRKILVAAAQSLPLAEVEEHLEELDFCLRRCDDALTLTKLKAMVPEYQPAGRTLEPAPSAKLAIHPSALRAGEGASPA